MGAIPAGKLPTWSERVARGSDSMPPSKTISTIKTLGGIMKSRAKTTKKIADINIFVIEVGAGHVLRPLSKNPTTKNVKKNPTLDQWKQKAHVSNEEDQAMGEPEVLLIHSSIENLIAVQPSDKGLEEGEERCNTPNKKLFFDLSGRNDGKSQGKWVDTNPFETLNEEAGVSGFFKKTLETLEEGWTFQGKKKHKVKIATTRPAIGHPSQLDASLTTVLGEKRG
jgi:hypothetical protein